MRWLSVWSLSAKCAPKRNEKQWNYDFRKWTAAAAGATCRTICEKTWIKFLNEIHTSIDSKRISQYIHRSTIAISTVYSLIKPTYKYIYLKLDKFMEVKWLQIIEMKLVIATDVTAKTILYTESNEDHSNSDSLLFLASQHRLSHALHSLYKS